MARSSGYLPVEYTKLQGFDVARDHAGEQEGGRCNLSSTYPDAVTSWTESCANWLISMVPRGGDQQTHENNGLLKNGTQRCPKVSHSLFREGSRPHLILLESSGKPTGPLSFPTARERAGTKSSAHQDGYRRSARDLDRSRGPKLHCRSFTLRAGEKSDLDRQGPTKPRNVSASAAWNSFVFPHERSDLSHWHKRLGDKPELLLAESLRSARRRHLAQQRPQAGLRRTAEEHGKPLRGTDKAPATASRAAASPADRRLPIGE